MSLRIRVKTHEYGCIDPDFGGVLQHDEDSFYYDLHCLKIILNFDFLQSNVFSECFTLIKSSYTDH